MSSRYLLTFSYIGTGFRGSFKTIKDGLCYATIQGNLELGLLKLRPKQFPQVTLSSRTDAGVHALECTAHVDLETNRGNSYQCVDIRQMLNRYFCSNEKDISVQNIIRVNPNFHARFNAKSRTYLYRIAVLKKGVSPDLEHSSLPIEERGRLYYLKNPDFEIEKVKDAIKLFEGEHDFETFKKFRKNYFKSSRRIIYTAEITRGAPMLTTHTLQKCDYLDYWDFKFRANGFLYNQIRRLVGSLIAVGNGKLKVEDIVTMLQIPSKNSWPSSIAIIPPSGLYLCSVEYKKEDLTYDQNLPPRQNES